MPRHPLYTGGGTGGGVTIGQLDAAVANEDALYKTANRADAQKGNAPSAAELSAANGGAAPALESGDDWFVVYADGSQESWSYDGLAWSRDWIIPAGGSDIRTFHVTAAADQRAVAPAVADAGVTEWVVGSTIRRKLTNGIVQLWATATTTTTDAAPFDEIMPGRSDQLPAVPGSPMSTAEWQAGDSFWSGNDYYVVADVAGDLTAVDTDENTSGGGGGGSPPTSGNAAIGVAGTAVSLVVSPDANNGLEVRANGAFATPGAGGTGEANVQADWNQTTATDDAFIQNKPATISTTQAAAIAANTLKTGNATHTGDVTGDTALTIVDDAVTNAKAANMAAGTIKGASVAGDPQDLTAAQARTILNVEDGATADQTGAEIKTAYEANADTNAFDDAALAKLNSLTVVYRGVFTSFAGLPTGAAGQYADVDPGTGGVDAERYHWDVDDAAWVKNAGGSTAYTHPNHTGDVTSAGDGATTIAANAVDNTKAADMPTLTIKGNATGATADPQDLTGVGVRLIAGIEEYTGNALQPVRINAGETAIEAYDPATLGLPVTSQAGAYTFAATDANSIILNPNTAAVTWTVPDDSVAIPVGAVVRVINTGSNSITMATAGGVTLHAKRNARTILVGSAITFVKEAANIWSASDGMLPAQIDAAGTVGTTTTHETLLGHTHEFTLSANLVVTINDNAELGFGYLRYTQDATGTFTIAVAGANNTVDPTGASASGLIHWVKNGDGSYTLSHKQE